MNIVSQISGTLDSFSATVKIMRTKFKCGTDGKMYVFEMDIVSQVSGAEKSISDIDFQLP